MLRTSGVARDRASGLYLAGSALVARPTIVGKMEGAVDACRAPCVFHVARGMRARIGISGAGERGALVLR
jgi:hypothetical protein